MAYKKLVLAYKKLALDLITNLNSIDCEPLK